MPRTLRLLSYNIQAGTATSSFADYFTGGWRHVLPHGARVRKLESIGEVLENFDIVGLQETDIGSLRTGFVNITQFLAERAAFPYWTEQSNRDLAGITRTGNALLSRLEPASVVDYRLPGGVRSRGGRGALLANFRLEDAEIAVIVVHLALNQRARGAQLRYLSRLIRAHPHVVLMGDMNATLHSEEVQHFLNSTHLRDPVASLDTFPSWNPQRAIDHILVSEGLGVQSVEVLTAQHSDHRPLALELAIDS